MATRQKNTKKTPSSNGKKGSRAARQVGLAGFDFKGLNAKYTAGDAPINDAAAYGVTVEEAAVDSGADYWRVAGVYHLTPDENRSRHNIFVDAVDETGKRIKRAIVQWTWAGNNAPPNEKKLDKPVAEPGADIPISEGDFQLWISADVPSDKVSGIHYRHPDESNSAGELLNTWGHHSFYVVFERATKQANGGSSASGEENGAGEPAIVNPQPPVPAAGRIPVRDKIGIDANRPIHPQTGKIAPQVANPAIIGATGVGWVRLNFVLGQPWAFPHDQNRPSGLTWEETYSRIIDGFRGQKLRIYGLISDEAMREHLGDRFRSPAPAGAGSDDWIRRYVDSFVWIVERFHDKVEVFESFNEPDDWHGAQMNWVHPTWFAVILQEIHSAIRSHHDPAVRGVRLVSGPLQGLDINDNAGFRYLRATLQAGKSRFGWGHSGVPFPFDGVGYHLYIAQDAGRTDDHIRHAYRTYVDQVRDVMREEMGREAPIYLSEYGWTHAAVGEERQAQCMDLGMRLSLEDPAIALSFWFCTQDFALKYGLYREGNLDPGNRKPVYGAFHTLCHSDITVAAPTGGQPPTETAWTGVVSARQTAVRSGPGVEHAIIGTVRQKDAIEVVGRHGVWLEIAWTGIPAFVHSDAVGVSGAPREEDWTGELTPPPGADPVTQTVAATWNTYRQLLLEESARVGIDPGVALAVLVAEANGRAFGADGRMIIRFENHIFYQKWGQEHPTLYAAHFEHNESKSWTGHRWRPHSSAPWQTCHANQRMEWLVFAFARQLDETAAMLSISMGAPQIMGFNHATIGYESVQAMFSAFQESERAQLTSLFRFMEVNNLVAAVQQGDFHTFAARYNGSGQAAAYAEIIRNNLAAFQALTGTAPRAAALPDASARQIGPPNLAEAWADQVRFGLDNSKGLFRIMEETARAGRVDAAVQLAQTAVILNSYWGRLVFQADEAAVNAAGNTATAQLGAIAAGGSPVPTVIASPGGSSDSPGSEHRGGRKRALCIGIDTYPIDPLAGCVADARLWAETLAAHGFDTPTLLLNKSATRAAILESIQELIATSRAGDIVVIQYAGHGTQLDDWSGDEATGDTPDQDEALVPIDFVTGAYVIDDDLRAVFADIPEGVNVTCFMDCCHSGSISREPFDPNRGDERPRRLVATPMMQEAHRYYRRSRSAGRSGAATELEAMREVVFSACQSDQLAWESNGQGEFTQHAIQVLTQAGAPLNHQQFIDAVVGAFGAQPRQLPLLECRAAAREYVLFEPVAV